MILPYGKSGKHGLDISILTRTIVRCIGISCGRGSSMGMRIGGGQIPVDLMGNRGMDGGGTRGCIKDGRILMVHCIIDRQEQIIRGDGRHVPTGRVLVRCRQR